MMQPEIMARDAQGRSVNGSFVRCPCGARYSAPLPLDGPAVRICEACGKGFRFLIRLPGYDTTNAVVTRAPLEPPSEERAESVGALKAEPVIVTKRHRRRGLPHRPVFVVTLPANVTQKSAADLQQTLRHVRGATFVLMPHGYVVQQGTDARPLGAGSR